MATNAVLDLSALNAVTAYEPNELIVTVEAGAPLADVLSLIDSKNQQFAFEPMDTAPLLGTAGSGTIGGMIAHGPGRAAPDQGGRGARPSARRACGLGLRRQLQDRRQGGEERHRLRPLQAARGFLGHARGHDRGDAEGDAAAGERADAGAARPRRPHRQPRHDRGARFAFRRLRRRPMCRLPRCGRRSAGSTGSARRARRSRWCGSRASWPRPPIGRLRLRRHLRRSAAAEIAGRRGLGRGLACDPRRRAPSRRGERSAAWPVWRIVCPPAAGGALGQALARETGGEVIYDWGGGLIWAALPPKPDAQAALVRSRVNAAGGHAMLLRASDDGAARSRRVPSASAGHRRA